MNALKRSSRGGRIGLNGSEKIPAIGGLKVNLASLWSSTQRCHRDRFCDFVYVDDHFSPQTCDFRHASLPLAYYPPTPCHTMQVSHSLPGPKHLDYFTINTDDGTSPASFSVFDQSTSPWNVFLGNVIEKLVTSFPVSLWSCCANSNSVVSAGSVFKILPESVCSRSLASLWFALGLDAAAGAATGTGSGAGALPSRAALASSALRRRSALSASILALMRFLASTSACFSWRFLATSLSCSLFTSSSLACWVSLVDFWRIF